MARRGRENGGEAEKSERSASRKDGSVSRVGSPLVGRGESGKKSSANVTEEGGFSVRVGWWSERREECQKGGGGGMKGRKKRMNQLLEKKISEV